MLFLFLLLLAIQERGNNVNSDYVKLSKVRADTFVVYIVLIFFIGMRHNVGADWGAYENVYNRMEDVTFYDLFSLKDFGYQFLNYSSYYLGLSIYFVNFICAGIFVSGLFIFSKTLQRPWLALLVAYPYLILVVGMGYTRQAAALGMVMWALTSNNFIKYCLLVFIGALFHKSAILMIPLVILITSTSKIILIPTMIVTAFIGYKVMLESSVDELMYVYVEREYQSSGAMIRVFMSVLPATILLFFNKYFIFESIEKKKLWMVISFASIFSFFLLLVANFSTAIDRVALYYIPLQLYVISQIPEVFFSSSRKKMWPVLLISCYLFSVLFVWLVFADNSKSWLPYQMFPFNLL